MGVGARKRFRILMRDGFRCRYCGAQANAAGLEVDHVVPRAKGGSDHPDNLVTACVACNGGKSDLSVSDRRCSDLQALMLALRSMMQILERVCPDERENPDLHYAVQLAGPFAIWRLGVEHEAGKPLRDIDVRQRLLSAIVHYAAEWEFRPRSKGGAP